MADGKFQPYLFEPDTSKKNNKTKKRKTSLEEPEVSPDPLSDESWCQCGKCPSRREIKERVCCANLHTVENIHKEGSLCVTDSEVFAGVCLYEPVLMFNYFMQRYNEYARVYRTGDPISNKSYRYCSYRTFTFWSQGRLGRFTRRVIPACVIQTIRGQYPEVNGVYVGYTEPDEVDDFNEFI